MHRLIKIVEITGVIRLRSGLHIGAGKDSVEIGGLDQPIIKNPVTQEPYIPGSSLRGKMRSMLETSILMDRPETRKHVSDGSPCGCGQKDCPACVVFGAHCNDKAETGISRLLVRDAELTEEYRTMFGQGRLRMEIKNENIINRVSGVAEHPRPLERVPAGTCFGLGMAIRVYEGDDAILGRLSPLDYVLRGLKLLTLDAIGGGGSRGNGQIAIENLRVDGAPRSLDDIPAF